MGWEWIVVKISRPSSFSIILSMVRYNIFRSLDNFFIRPTCDFWRFWKLLLISTMRLIISSSFDSFAMSLKKESNMDAIVLFICDLKFTILGCVQWSEWCLLFPLSVLFWQDLHQGHCTRYLIWSPIDADAMQFFCSGSDNDERNSFKCPVL